MTNSEQIEVLKPKRVLARALVLLLLPVASPSLAQNYSFIDYCRDARSVAGQVQSDEAQRQKAEADTRELEYAQVIFNGHSRHVFGLILMEFMALSENDKGLLGKKCSFDGFELDVSNIPGAESANSIEVAEQCVFIFEIMTAAFDGDQSEHGQAEYKKWQSYSARALSLSSFLRLLEGEQQEDKHFNPPPKNKTTVEACIDVVHSAGDQIARKLEAGVTSLSFFRSLLRNR